jgi:LysM repeat protein
MPIKNNETLVYTVQPGETEDSVSKKLLISVELLREIAHIVIKTYIYLNSENNELKERRFLVPGGKISFPPKQLLLK